MLLNIKFLVKSLNLISNNIITNKNKIIIPPTYIIKNIKPKNSQFNNNKKTNAKTKENIRNIKPKTGLVEKTVKITLITKKTLTKYNKILVNTFHIINGNKY